MPGSGSKSTRSGAVTKPDGFFFVPPMRQTWKCAGPTGFDGLPDVRSSQVASRQVLFLGNSVRVLP